MGWIHRGISNGTSQPARPSSSQSVDKGITSDCHTSAVPTRLSPHVVIDACKSTFSSKTHIATCISPLDTCVCVFACMHACIHAKAASDNMQRIYLPTYLSYYIYQRQAGKRVKRTRGGTRGACLCPMYFGQISRRGSS